MPLNDKQAAFAREYLVDLNATQAAIRAGYSAATAKQQGARLLTHVDVQALITSAKTQRAHQTGIDAAWVLKRLADEAEADMGDLYAPDGSLRPVSDWPVIWRKGLVAGLDVEERTEAGQVVSVIRKVKLSDRIKRIELIGKHVDVGAFSDKVEHTGAMAIVVSNEDAGL
jgi:phage terminase small subunit